MKSGFSELFPWKLSAVAGTPGGGHLDPHSEFPWTQVWRLALTPRDPHTTSRSAFGRLRAVWWRTAASGQPTTRAAAGRPPVLDLGLFGHLQRVVNFDPEIPHGILELGMPE